jgi:hypothetical protein
LLRGERIEIRLHEVPGKIGLLARRGDRVDHAADDSSVKVSASVAAVICSARMHCFNAAVSYPSGMQIARKNRRLTRLQTSVG